MGVTLNLTDSEADLVKTLVDREVSDGPIEEVEVECRSISEKITRSKARRSVNASKSGGSE